MSTALLCTPLPIIAQVSRIVPLVIERVMGGRADFSLMVSASCVEALKCFGIESRVMYGQAAWVEILENHKAVWTGFWGENFHFWVATQYGEVIDLNVSVAFRIKKPQSDKVEVKPFLSPPILWSSEVPSFYRYIPEGVAELELQDEREIQKYELVLDEIRKKCDPTQINLEVNAQSDDLDFLNEAILCPGRKILDDSKQSFRLFDRALCVSGIPEAPI